MIFTLYKSKQPKPTNASDNGIKYKADRYKKKDFISSSVEEIQNKSQIVNNHSLQLKTRLF